MKFSTILSLAAVVGSASAFAPMAQSKPSFGVARFMSEESDSSSTALVPIKEETVEFTAGILGGVAGFAVGGPVLGAIGAAAANYVSKSEGDVSEVISAVSKSSIQVYNYLATLDSKYEVLSKAQSSLEDSLTKLKGSANVNPDTVAKVEAALDSTKSKIEEINDEYDLVGAGVTAFGVIGDLVEKAVTKAGNLNEEYKLTDKAMEALNGAVSKAKDAAQK